MLKIGRKQYSSRPQSTRMETFIVLTLKELTNVVSETGKHKTTGVL